MKRIITKIVAVPISILMSDWNPGKFKEVYREASWDEVKTFLRIPALILPPFILFALGQAYFHPWYYRIPVWIIIAVGGYFVIKHDEEEYRKRRD